MIATIDVETRGVSTQVPVDPATGATRVGALSRFVRRPIDVAVASALLAVLSPLLGAISLAVYIDSGAPVVFRQQRLGRGMRPFTVLKFRTMRAGADSARHREYVRTLIGSRERSAGSQLYKLSVDDRITPVGRVLRRWSLDELPQLFNVLRGDMALVGPRPVIPYEADLYPESYLDRFRVKPGMTGLWQVSGRNLRTYDEMVRLDIEYVERESLWLDLQILCKTVPVILGRQGVS